MKDRPRKTLVRLLAVAALGVVLTGSASLAVAQDATPEPSEHRATISVNGRGSVMVVPDAASVVAGVTITEETLSGAQTTATETMDAILAALGEAGIDSEDVQTASYFVQVLQSYDENGMPSGINQFQVSNQVSITIRNIDNVGPVLDSVVAAGSNTIYGVTFIVTDPTDAAAEARVLAVSDARARADQLAEAAGLTVGPIISLSETYGPSPLAYGRGGAAMAEDRAVPIEAGTSAVTVDVEIVYELIG